MGMYTQMDIDITFKEPVPGPVQDAIKWFDARNPRRVDDDTKPDIDDLFFEDGRACFITFGHVSGNTYNVTTDVKNYDFVIEKFLAWVVQHVVLEDGMDVGWYEYEEDECPSRIVAKKTGDGFTFLVAGYDVHDTVEYWKRMNKLEGKD